jgi:hypothetical protein
MQHASNNNKKKKKKLKKNKKTKKNRINIILGEFKAKVGRGAAEGIIRKRFWQQK